MGRSISEAEWKVMEVLWQKPGSTLREVVVQLCDSGWSHSTIKTLLKRLIEKGVVEVDKSGEYFRYWATVEEQRCKVGEAKAFLSRVFHGSVSMLVSMMTKECALTEEEQEELRRLVEQMEGRE